MMASALNHIRSQLNTLSRGIIGLEPGGFGLGNILAPFLKTGANVIEMGISGTLAPVRELTYQIQKARKKQMPDLKRMTLNTDWAYFALTIIATALLASLWGDDDEWYIEPYQTGQAYDPNKPYDSIRIGNYWIKLDMFGPLEVPMRVAIKIVDDWEDKKLEAVANGLGFGLSEAFSSVPLADQFFDNQVDYMTKKPGSWASGFAYNQLNKAVPAQFKTLTRAGSRAAGLTWDTPWMGKIIDRKFHRNYGLDGEQLTTNDLINILTNRLKYQPQ
jgi:hypothetical protein